jgi:hypothetical protein
MFMLVRNTMCLQQKVLGIELEQHWQQAVKHTQPFLTVGRQSHSHWTMLFDEQKDSC